MAKELMEIGGFITEGAEIVNHDNTLSGNGTVDSPLCVVPGYNETVLYDSSALISSDQAYGTTFNISEPVTNFERFKIYYTRFPWTDQCPSHQIQEFDSTVPVNAIILHTTFATSTATNPNWYVCTETITDITGTTWKLNACIQYQIPNGNSNSDWIYLKPYKVVGINRISGNE